MEFSKKKRCVSMGFKQIEKVMLHKIKKEDRRTFCYSDNVMSVFVVFTGIILQNFYRVTEQVLLQ